MWSFVIVWSCLAWFDGPASGPPVGEQLKEIKVLGFSGPEAGKEFDVLQHTKQGPTLLIFVHELTRPGLQLLRPVDEFAARQPNLATRIIWLGDKEATEEYLKRAQPSLNLQSPVCISLDGKNGPAAYGLNDRVKITVLLAKNQKVLANFAFVDPNGKDARQILQAGEKLLEK